MRSGFVRPGFGGVGFGRPAFARRAVFYPNRRFHHNRFFFAPAFAFGVGAPYYYSNYYDGGCYYVSATRLRPVGLCRRPPRAGLPMMRGDAAPVSFSGGGLRRRAMPSP